ncbi:MAG: imidazole glycerol phosphate synthase subunit HisH [Chloroflexi bacterium]|nr:imidazole glycerol phosphate synthase subunit HisH [Chloroflexota bacterium]
MIAIVDYGIGNIRSVWKALEYLGVEAALASDAATLAGADGIVLPGVAAFGDAAAELRRRGLESPLREAIAADQPFLGICVGMQLLFEESEEMGRHRGLGVLSGRVRRFPAGQRAPQLGWNQVLPRRFDPLLAGFGDGEWAYFAHSYYAEPAEPAVVLGETEYGCRYASLVGKGRLYGIQFHLEKSQAAGLRILGNFARLAEQAAKVGAA